MTTHRMVSGKLGTQQRTLLGMLAIDGRRLEYWHVGQFFTFVREADGHALDVRPTLKTVDGLIRRGLLKIQPKSDWRYRDYVISDWGRQAIGEYSPADQGQRGGSEG